MSVLLPQNDDSAARRGELFQAQLEYRYVYDWPPGVATASKLEEDDDYGVKYTAKALPIYAAIAENNGERAISLFSRNPLHSIRKLFDDMTARDFRRKIFTMVEDIVQGAETERPASWEDYEDIFKTWEKPPILDYFHRSAADLDLAFAWQRVAGCNPMVLRRIERTPDNLPLTVAIFAQVMGSSDSLDAAYREGRVYLADYAALEGTIAGNTEGLQKYVAAPMCVYAVEKRSGNLRPVAIQCGQTPGANAPLFTPNDGWHWRMALTQVQTADANHHEAVAHLGRTHMVMESVTLALKRQLAHAHPLRVLLTPHCDHTLAINDSAKFSLTAPNGVVDRCFGPRIDEFGRLVRTAVQTLSWENLNPHRDLASRGLDNTEALPNHPYREDAGELWDVIRSWIQDYVGYYYRSAEDVLQDTELSAFARELGSNDGGRIPGVPVPKTVDELVEFVTRIVFTATAQHSAVNFAQFPFMGVTVNMPGASYAPAPTMTTPNNTAAYLAMLPPMHMALTGASMVYLLSHLRTSELGDYGDKPFAESPVMDALSRFQESLKTLETKNALRDRTRLMSYPFLRPSQVLQSISI